VRGFTDRRAQPQRKGPAEKAGKVQIHRVCGRQTQGRYRGGVFGQSEGKLLPQKSRGCTRARDCRVDDRHTLQALPKKAKAVQGKGTTACRLVAADAFWQAVRRPSSYQGQDTSARGLQPLVCEDEIQGTSDLGADQGNLPHGRVGLSDFWPAHKEEEGCQPHCQPR